MKTTIVHLTLGLEVGGQEKLLVEFAKQADRDRFALHFVSLTTAGPIADEILATGWPVTALQLRDGLRPEAVPRLARLFARLRAGVIHTHDERPNIYGGPAAWLVGARCIHTRHSQGASLSARQRLLVRAASETNDVFVCISRDSARQAIHQGIAARRVAVIPNGIDLARFAYRGPNPTGPAVIVARLAPEKDLGTLIEAAALLRARVPDFRLEIAGDGPCRAQWEAQAAPLGDTVRFLGMVRDVPALLERARLFVLSSVTEGISLTLLEAMARGLPIVATRVGGNPEVVADGQTGLLVAARQPAALAEAIAKCWTQPGLCAKMSEAARERVEMRFNVRLMTSAYERLYSDEKPRRWCRSGELCVSGSSMAT
jgi:glycosyltransferase involved in cell wall biosynthesis